MGLYLLWFQGSSSLSQKKEKQMIQVSYNSKERKRVSVKFSKYGFDQDAAIDRGAIRCTDTYEEDAQGVWQTLHGQLTVLEVVIAHIQHFIDVDVWEGQHNDNEADYDIHARQVKHPCTESNAKADGLSEPEYEV